MADRVAVGATSSATPMEPEATVDDAIAGAPPPLSRGRDRLSAVLYPVATFTVLLLAWQFLVRLFGVPEYILPVPSEFLAKLVESRALIWQHTLVTAKRGRARISAGRRDRRPARPDDRVVQVAGALAVPVDRFLPADSEDRGRAAVRRLVRLRAVSEGAAHFHALLLPDAGRQHDRLSALWTSACCTLTRSMGANAGQTFRYIRLPSALAHIFGGFKVSIVFAATGAIVAEFVGVELRPRLPVAARHQLSRHAADLRGPGGARGDRHRVQLRRTAARAPVHALAAREV